MPTARNQLTQHWKWFSTHTQRTAGSPLMLAGVGLLFLVLVGAAVAIELRVLDNRRIDAGIPTCSAAVEWPVRCATERPGRVVRVQYLDIVHDSEAKASGVRLTIQFEAGDTVVADIDNFDVDFDPSKIKTDTAVVGRFWNHQLGQIVFTDGTRVLVPPLFDSLKATKEQVIVLFGIPLVGFVFAFLVGKAWSGPRWAKIMLLAPTLTISIALSIALNFSFNGVSDAPIPR